MTELEKQLDTLCNKHGIESVLLALAQVFAEGSKSYKASCLLVTSRDLDVMSKLVADASILARTKY